VYILKMRLFIRKGRSSYPVLVCPAQQFVDSEDFMIAMRKHVRSGGNVHNMYVEFEYTQIPVTHISEIRVLSQMAAGYHNSCLAQNLSGEKDLYGKPYDATKWPDLDTEEEDNTWSEVVTDRKKIHNSTTSKDKSRESRDKSKESKQMEWDEDMHGERVVFDSTFEINEHLVPWLMDPDNWEEKYGMY
jgi:hypothetical protein